MSEELVKALEWYADKKNYGCCDQNNPVCLEEGKIAREALASHRAKQEITVESLAEHLRNSQCKRLDAKYAADPFFGSALRWSELSEDDKEAYRDVSRDALAFFVQCTKQEPQECDAVNVSKAIETLTSAIYLMKPEKDATYETDAGRRHVIGEMECLIDDLKTPGLRITKSGAG